MAISIYLICFSVSILLGFIFKYRKKIKQKNKRILTYDEIINSKEEIILYLRSFNDDGLGKSSPDTRSNMLISTFEQNISSELKNNFFVTIGRPGEDLPQLGAHRFYINDEDWKKQVSNLIKKSKLIIIKPSKTLGIKWELDYIIKNNFKDRLILFHQYDDFTDKEVLKFYYDELKFYLLEKYKIEMTDFKKNMKFSHFQDENHILSKSLKSIINNKSF
jgi:hypothetical protein